MLDPPPRAPLGLEGPRVLDCDRCPVTGELQQLYIALIERPMRQHSHVQNTEQMPTGE
jgi:hypothetical protein